MSELLSDPQVACVTVEPSAPQVFMEVHPTFYPDTNEWVAEVDGQEITAASLHALQQLLPDAQIKDYHPHGYTAFRDSKFLLKPSGYLRYVSEHPPARKSLFAAKAKALGKARAAVAAADEKPKVKVRKQRKSRPALPATYDNVLDLWQKKNSKKTICRALACSIGFVQECLDRARQKYDLRTKREYDLSSKHLMIQSSSGKERRYWTDEEDAVLRELAAKGFSADKIGELTGETRCAIVGRCRRIKVRLLGNLGFARRNYNGIRVAIGDKPNPTGASNVT